MTVFENSWSKNLEDHFRSGFASDMNAKMNIEDFYTPDGRQIYATVEIDGVTYEVHYWYAQAYLPVKDPNYIMDYTFMIKWSGSICAQFEARKDNLITVKRFNSVLGADNEN